MSMTSGKNATDRLAPSISSSSNRATAAMAADDKVTEAEYFVQLIKKIEESTQAAL